MKTFAEIVAAVKEYQALMGVDYSTLTDEERMQKLRDFTVALSCEQTELLDEVSWKPWRSYESQKPKPNQRKIALEWVDCLIFLIDQSFCLQLSSDDILRAFKTKLEANIQRVYSGYSKTNS